MVASNADRNAIRAIMENWVLWRDSCDWDRFRTLWHKNGVMVATWFQGTYEEFIAASDKGFREGQKTGASIIHMLGAISIDIKGKRAIAQAKMAILQRGPIDGVMCDVTCNGRFLGFIEKRGTRWGMVLMRPIYEKDRLDPVDPSARIALDQSILSRFPRGYQHLAYLQTKAGFNVKTELPSQSGPPLEALYAMRDRWLKGGKL